MHWGVVSLDPGRDRRESPAAGARSVRPKPGTASPTRFVDDQRSLNRKILDKEPNAKTGRHHGFDIGSGQVVAVVANGTPTPKARRVLGAVDRPARASRAAWSSTSTKRRVRSPAPWRRPKMAGLSGATRGVLIGVRGGHIQTFNHHGAMNIARTDKEITLAGLRSGGREHQSGAHLPDREIVHVIPQDFILDRQSGVPNPRRHGGDPP